MEILLFIGHGDDGIGNLLGLLSSGKLDLSGDAVEITTDLAPQSHATIGPQFGVLLWQASDPQMPEI